MFFQKKTLNQIKSNYLFEGINKDDISLDFDQENFLELEAGEKVFLPGDTAGQLYLILKGKVSIKFKTPDGGVKIVERKTNGFFGEKEILEGTKRVSSAAADEDTTLYVLWRKDINPLMEQHLLLVTNLKHQAATDGVLGKVTRGDAPARVKPVVSEDYERDDEVTLKAEEAFGNSEVNDSGSGDTGRYWSQLFERGSAGSRLTRRQLLLLLEAVRRINESFKSDDIKKAIIEAAALLTGADKGLLYYHDKANDEIWTKIFRGNVNEKIRFGSGHGIAGLALKTGNVILINDVNEDSRFHPKFDNIGGYDIKSLLSFPIKNSVNEIPAVLHLYNSKRDEFSESDINILEILQPHMASALQKSLAIEKLLGYQEIDEGGKLKLLDGFMNFIMALYKQPVNEIEHLVDLLDKDKLTPKNNRLLGALIENTRNLGSHLKTVRNYTSGSLSIEAESGGINRILSEVLSRLAEYTKDNAVSLLKKFDRSADVLVDEKEFYMAAFQIVRNAVESMKGGGKLFVTTEVGKDKVYISFKDTGTGIPADVQSKIFQPFFSYGKEQSAGLGLSLVRKIIKDMDGSIQVHSSPDKGTNVVISLPVIKDTIS